ncbi:MAG: alpha-L-fucosidase [Prolixibacteraceae bacterium]|nr:alpha-L-fucosidase [Prolixibacteraceae bacterium]
MKYGLFVHYARYATVYSDGRSCRDLDELTANFDPTAFAADAEAMGVEYVIFTAWHAGMFLLYQSPKMDSWIQGHSSKNDLIGPMIDALRAKGIKVLLYTHPYLGYHFTDTEKTLTGWGSGANSQGDDAPNWATFNGTKWNNFINDIYGELVDKYGSRLDGLYMDEGDRKARMDKTVDFSRLRATIKSRNPNLILVQNYGWNAYCSDITSKEYAGNDEFSQSDGSLWPSREMHVAPIISNGWLADMPREAAVLRYSAEGLFRYTVLQAGTNAKGGGVSWGAGWYADGGWGKGIKEQLVAVGSFIGPIAKSIKNTYASTSWVTSNKSTISAITWGVATQSTDGKYEFIHVLKPPTGKKLSLSKPADGKKFSAAKLLTNDHAVTLFQDSNGVSLTLAGDDNWDSLDTVIQLTVQNN